ADAVAEQLAQLGDSEIPLRVAGAVVAEAEAVGPRLERDGVDHFPDCDGVRSRWRSCCRFAFGLLAAGGRWGGRGRGYGRGRRGGWVGGRAALLAPTGDQHKDEKQTGQPEQ